MKLTTFKEEIRSRKPATQIKLVAECMQTKHLKITMLKV